MADLSDIQAAIATKIIGANASGVETNPVDATANRNLLTADILNAGGGTQGALTVGTSSVEVKVGGSALTNRKSVTLYNNSSATIYWGWSNAVSTTTGTPIAPGLPPVCWAVGAAQTIFVIAATAGNDTRITECP